MISSLSSIAFFNLHLQLYNRNYDESDRFNHVFEILCTLSFRRNNKHSNDDDDDDGDAVSLMRLPLCLFVCANERLIWLKFIFAFI